MHNCTTYPHNPPWCGCPTGSAPAPELPTTTEEDAS